MVSGGEFGLLRGIVSTAAMDEVFSDGNGVQAMVRFEAALAGALEECGLASAGSAAAVEGLLGETFLTPSRAEELQKGVRAAGNLAIPLVKLLTAAVAERDPAAAGFVHTGATSQDVLDSALALQMQAAFGLLRPELGKLHMRCEELARLHSGTVMVGRTWLQQGPPVTLGLKFAGAAAALDRHRVRMEAVAERAVRLQFGGAVGTLASLGTKGLEVSEALSRRLGLPEAPLPWHTQRDNLADVAATLGMLVGTLGKMARDVSLLMQTEVGELLEPAGAGRGGSSTMPHKRNPVGCAAVLAAAVRAPGLVATMLFAMTQEHERGLGGWQAEWETLPELFRLAAGALSQMNGVVAGIEVQGERMAANLLGTQGPPQGLNQAEAVSRALALHVGRARAHEILEAASHLALASRESLQEVLAANPEVSEHLSGEELRRLLDPRQYLGSASAFIERALRRQAAEGDERS